MCWKLNLKPKYTSHRHKFCDTHSTISKIQPEFWPEECLDYTVDIYFKMFQKQKLHNEIQEIFSLLLISCSLKTVYTAHIKFHPVCAGALFCQKCIYLYKTRVFQYSITPWLGTNKENVHSWPVTKHVCSESQKWTVHFLHWQQRLLT
jgi:hypothetical protein